MAVFVARPQKFIGSAGKLTSYYEDAGLDTSTQAAGYYGIERDGILFENVSGKAGEHLEGLDLSRGLTREQHAEIHMGSWGGEQLVAGGYRPVCDRDAQGRPIKYLDEETGKREPRYEYETIVDKHGNEVLKKKMEPVFVSGYDIPFAWDKSVSEFLIAHPEETENLQRFAQESIDTAMRHAEAYFKLVAKTIAAPSMVGGRATKTQGSATELVNAEGLLWFTSFGMSSRPTVESRERGYGADCHFHGHTFLSSVAYVGDGKFQKVDGKEIFQNLELLATIASVTFNRLLEEHGVHIRYSDADRKGRIYADIQGSNVDARLYFSTNSQRAWKVQNELERELGRPPTKAELDAKMSRTKGAKSKDAKQADVLGNEVQASRWKQALDDAGIELTITDVGKPVERSSVDERLDVLFARLERPDGVARDIDTAPIFGPEVVIPAVWRAAEGLGFDADQLSAAAGIYRDTHLVLVRDAVDPSARLYTTQTILDAESAIADALGVEAAQQSSIPMSLDEEIITKALRSQRYSLDSDQEQAVRAICSEARLVHIVGKAGSGKTSALKPAVAALREAGAVGQVIVVAVARKRANETAADVDADLGASIESLRYKFEHGWKPTKNTLVILDEAALANTFDMAELLRIIGPARLVTVGDSKQATAIGAAGWYADELIKRPPITLTTVYRHSSELDAEAFDMVRDGDAAEALSNLTDRGLVFAVEAPGDLIKLTRERFEHHLATGRPIEDIAIVHQGSNLALDAFNRMVQRVRLDAGEIDEFETFTCAELTTGRRWTLHKGDRVIFNKGVYFGLDEPIMNGTTATVVRMDGDGRCRVQLDTADQRTVTIDLPKEAETQPLAPAYACSTSKFQGGEVPVAIVIPGNPGIASLNSGYSAITRSTETTEILLDRATWGENPAHTLAQAWSREQVKTQASGYLEGLDDDYDFMSSDSTYGHDASNHDDILNMTERDDALDEIKRLREEYGFGNGEGLTL
jgi:hypothetical protein